MEIKLERSTPEIFSSIKDFYDEFKSTGEKTWEIYVPRPGESASTFCERLLGREVNPEAPLVPETVYWALNADVVCGRISLRHRLDANLMKVGGHIGFEVSPLSRRAGVGTEMLKKILKTSKAHEIKSLLLTCSPENKASIRIIEKCGGVLQDTIFVESLSEERARYWIHLKP